MSHALDAWRAYLAAHDPAQLWELLDPDAVFESPVVHTLQRGREITYKYLMGAADVLGGWAAGSSPPQDSKLRNVSSVNCVA